MLLYSHGIREVFVVFVQYLVVDGFSFCMDVEMMVRSDDYCCHETTNITTTGLFFPMCTFSRSLSLTYLLNSTTMIDCKILLYELLKKVKTAEMFTTKYFFVFFLSLFSCIEVSLEEEDFCFLSISFKSFILCYIIVHVLHFVV